MPGLTGIRVRNKTAAGATFRLPDYAGLNTDLTAVQNFISANNGGTTDGSPIEPFTRHR